MTVLWTTEELPGLAFDPDPEPDEDDNGPWCHTPTGRDLWGQGIHARHLTTINLTGSYL